jgi:hypothetical protein
MLRIFLFLFLLELLSCVSSSTDVDIAELLSNPIFISEKSKLEINHKEDAQTLAFTTTQWFIASFYSNSNCNAASTILNVGIVTNKCLYSQKAMVYFKLSCDGSLAGLSLYLDQGCTFPLWGEAYAYNQCTSIQRKPISVQCSITNTLDEVPSSFVPANGNAVIVNK